eukprot:1255379-Rhodomonas_salina.2
MLWHPLSCASSSPRASRIPLHSNWTCVAIGLSAAGSIRSTASKPRCKSVRRCARSCRACTHARSHSASTHAPAARSSLPAVGSCCEYAQTKANATPSASRSPHACMLTEARPSSPMLMEGLASDRRPWKQPRTCSRASAIATPTCSAVEACSSALIAFTNASNRPSTKGEEASLVGCSSAPALPSAEG